MSKNEMSGFIFYHAACLGKRIEMAEKIRMTRAKHLSKP
jgi:hypothetical protein